MTESPFQIWFLEMEVSMLSVNKDYFEEVLASASENKLLNLPRMEAEAMIRKYFPATDVMTKREVAEFMRCTERQIDRLRENHGFPWFRFGSQTRFSLCDVQHWIEEQKQCGPGSVPSLSTRKDV